VKTISLKKVSAVAVASLGFGLLSVVPANSAATVVSIYVNKFSPASNYTATFPGTSADVAAGSTAVTLVSGTFGTGTTDAGKAIYNTSTTLGYIGTIASVTSATALVLTAGATSIVAAGSTGLAASLDIGTPNTANTPYTVVNANGISGMTATAGASAAVMVGLTNAQGTLTTGKVRYIIDNAGVMGVSPAIPAAATNAFAPFTVPTTAGTYTGKVQYSAAGTFLGTAADQIDIAFTLTVVAASTLAPALSSAFMTEPSANGSSASSTTNGIARSAYKTADTAIAQIKVSLVKSDGTPDTAAHTVTAIVSGVGFTAISNAANTPGTAKTRVGTYNSGGSGGISYVKINSDGTAGTGTVTVSVTHAVTSVETTLGTFSYTSYGDVAALAVSTTNASIGKAGSTTGASVAARTVDGNKLSVLGTAGTETVPAFIVKATDSAGRAVNTVLAPSVVSLTSPAIATGGTCTKDDGALPTTASSSTNGIGFYNCNFATAGTAKSGDKATLTIRVTDPADATKYISTTFDVTVGGSVSTETLALDKTAYAPGEAMVVTRTGKDSSGNPVADGTASPAVTFSKAVGGTAPAAGFYKGGVSASSTSAATASVFAPTVAGAFSAIATSAATGAPTITASSSVTDANAAIATSIASLNAKIVALNALIAKIMKRLNIR
jgi:hypothetical protein